MVRSYAHSMRCVLCRLISERDSLLNRPGTTLEHVGDVNVYTAAKSTLAAEHARRPLRSLRRPSVAAGPYNLEPRRSDEHRGDFCFQKRTEDVEDTFGCFRNHR